MTNLVEKPWGTYEVLISSENYLAKRIVVYPNGRLSLQSHSHRSEHWVIVEGEGVVQRGEEEFKLKRDESVNIPVGVRHRISNLTSSNVIFIEVQIGDLLSEDDIVRYEDVYGRK
ncbi:MAG: phosphomannose isomerase type II C-terminal cupin domain [Rickettsiales bacterium]|jgi:mannose-6-phosphate isomerase-like protein (cupin superfamily)|nr:phosphomannose isomerase type II C-terminal cupin domain [Rickettsiales bacterium]